MLKFRKTYQILAKISIFANFFVSQRLEFQLFFEFFRFQNTEFLTPQQMNVPRIASEILELDDEVLIPRTIPKAPHSATKNQMAENEGAEEGINYKIPLVGDQDVKSILFHAFFFTRETCIT